MYMYMYVHVVFVCMKNFVKLCYALWINVVENWSTYASSIIYVVVHVVISAKHYNVFCHFPNIRIVLNTNHTVTELMSMVCHRASRCISRLRILGKEPRHRPLRKWQARAVGGRRVHHWTVWCAADGSSYSALQQYVRVQNPLFTYEV